MRGSVPRLPACPDHLPVITSGIRVRVQITGRNRQTVNGWNTRVRSAHDSVDKKIVKFGHFATVGTLHFDLAAKMVVGRKTFGPDHAKMVFAIRTHKRVIAWHWRTPASWNFAGRRKGNAVYVSLSQMSIKSLTLPRATIRHFSGNR